MYVLCGRVYAVVCMCCRQCVFVMCKNRENRRASDRERERERAGGGHQSLLTSVGWGVDSS